MTTPSMTGALTDPAAHRPTDALPDHGLSLRTMEIAEHGWRAFLTRSNCQRPETDRTSAPPRRAVVKPETPVPGMSWLRKHAIARDERDGTIGETTQIGSHGHERPVECVWLRGPDSREDLVPLQFLTEAPPKD